MQLQHIELDQLTIAKANVRKYRVKQVDNLIPSIESLGIIQPLLVRPLGSDFEIIAGQRRFHALQHIAANQSDVQNLEPIPCLVMDHGDDAKAVEASLAENVARLPMDEIDQYKAFAVLVKQGESVEEIANRFGTTARLVKQRLAIASLIPPILTAYRKDKIQTTTLRLLTMATKKQQRAWLELFNASDNPAPEGYALKSWLFGGISIPVENALFDVTAYDGNIITDLFEEDRYFDDVEKFWPLQSKAIAELKEQYLQDGWSDVVVLDIGEYFPAYEYVDTAKEDGGKIYIVISRDGEVTPYEGQLSREEIKSAKSKDSTEPTKPAKSEITKPLQNYLDLHRHSAVRSALLDHHGLALRVATAQIIAGSDLWAIHADPQKATKDATSDSLSDNEAETLFAKARESVLSLLELEVSDSGTVVPCKSDWQTRRGVGSYSTLCLNWMMSRSHKS